MNLLIHILNRRTFIAMLYTALVLIGVLVITQLPLELSPEVEYPRFSIITNYHGAPPEVVEAIVTSPIEQAVQRLNGIRSVSSVSTEGNSRVNVELQPHVVTDYILLEMNEHLAALYETSFRHVREITYPRIQRHVPRELEELQGFIILTVTGPGTINDVHRTADRHFIQPLLAVPGVSNVTISGGTERIVSIEVAPSLMKAYGVTMAHIQRSLAEYRRRVDRNIATAGFVRQSGMKIPVVIETSPDQLEDIRRAIVRTTNDGRNVLLDDVASVTITHMEPRSYRRINGLSAVTVTIEREPGTNIIQTANRVYAVLENIQTNLPPGYEIRINVDRSTNIREELDVLSNRAALALAFVLMVLVISLGSMRSPLYVISAILFSVFITLTGFYFAGLSVNVLTLAGLTLAFGMLVDNSIVVLDSIERSVRNAKQYRDALIEGASRVFLPVFAATGTTIIAFLPFVFLSEELRPFFIQFATALVISLSASLFVSFTLMPLLADRFPLAQSSRFSTRRLQDLLRTGYASTLRFALKRKVLTIGFSLLVIGVPFWLLPEKIDETTEDDKTRPRIVQTGITVYNATIGSDRYQRIRPYIDHGFGGATHLFFRYVRRGEVWQWGETTYLIVRVSMPLGTEIEILNGVMKEIEQELLPFVGQIDFFETNIYSSDEGQIRIEFPPAVQMSAFPYVLKAYLTSYAAQIGGAHVGVFGFGSGFFTGAAASPSFTVLFFGYNYNRLRELAEEFGERLKRNPRVANVETNRTFGRRDNLFEIAAQIDRTALKRYQLSVDDVLNTLRMHTGESIGGGQWFLDGEDIPYVVRYAGHEEFSVDDLLSQPVAIGDRVYKLDNILNLEQRRTLARIDRENQQYRRAVSFDYRGPWRFGREFLSEVIEEFDLPYGYSILDRYFWFVFRREHQIELTSILFLSVLLVFMVTASLYESFRKPFVVMITVPFAVAGVFLAFYLAGAQFDRGGYAAVALLAGISINNSILMVDAIARNHRSMGLLQAIVTGASTRIRAITITTLTTIAGLTPLLMEKETAQFWYSLGLGTIGGLVASYLFVLVLCPVVYSVVMERQKSEVRSQISEVRGRGSYDT